jgi:hypothetical protein
LSGGSISIDVICVSLQQVENRNKANILIFREKVIEGEMIMMDVF